MGALEFDERRDDTDKSTNGGARPGDGLAVHVAKRVQLDPRPIHPVTRNLYHDEAIAASEAHSLQAGEEVECLLVVEPCSSLQDTLGSQLMHVLLPMHQHAQEEEVRADSRVFKFRLVIRKIWSRA